MEQNNSTINVNSKGIDPTLAEVLADLKDDILKSTNCHAIAKVETFDKARQTITAKINYSKTYFKRVLNGKYEPYQVDYPLLIDMPAISLRGGKTGIRFPISQGDDCIVFFNDRDIDNWFSGSSNGGVATPRLHSFSDGIALVGLSSLSNLIEGYDDDAVFYNDKTEVRLKSDEATIQTEQAKIAVKSKITVENNSENLNTLLQELIIQLQALATTAPVPGNPLNPAVSAQLANIAIRIGGLLE